MKEQLKLKHLAPYLPYGLKMYNLNNGRGAYNNILKRRLKKIEILTGDSIELLMFLGRKPILRPLSELTELDINNKPKFFPSIMCVNCIDAKMIEQMPYEDFDYLIRNHFDVFGLIEKGLAINKNEI